MGHENRFDFPCRYCEKKFRVSRDRMLHERTHTGGWLLIKNFEASNLFLLISIERPYSCQQCQKSFAHKANYLSHLKTHDPRPAYDCKSCGLHHVSAAKLRIHEDIEHPDARPWKCGNCRKTFKQSHSLEHHKPKCAGLEMDSKL
jgi:KRAB domain-containing zinc finger protein